MDNCKNCDNKFDGKYCNICGQKHVERYTVQEIVYEFIHGLTHADAGFFSMIPRIILKPGLVAHDYIAGKRKRYFNLFQFFIIVAGISVFVTEKINQKYTQPSSYEQTSNDYESSDSPTHTSKKITEWMGHHSNLVLLLCLPIYAFFSWKFFNNPQVYNFNYAEHIIVNMVCVSLNALLTIFLFLFLPLFRNVFHMELSTFVIFNYAAMLFSFYWVYKQLFNLPLPPTLGKTLLVILLSMAVQFILGYLITIFAVIIT